MRTTTLFICMLVVTSALLIAGCAQQQQPAQPPQTVQQSPQATAVPAADTVKVSDTSSGKTLVDSKGMTLYYFTNDIFGSGKSSCSGQCSLTWPVFSGDMVVVSPPLASSDFSSFTRTDGIKQATYKGRPLYFYNADTKPGDTKGQGVNNVWFIANVSGTVPAVTVPATTVLTTQPRTTATTSRGGYGY